MTMSKSVALIGSAIIATAAFHAAPASAQATRTWVSGVGDDVNPCSRTAPCKTFAGAISKTAAGGQISCLDPGGFGGVNITKSIAIICDYTEAGVLVSTGVNGVVVNAGPSDSIFLSGLDFHGSSTGASGVRFIGGRLLHIQNSNIRRFNSADSKGISFAPSGASRLVVTDSTIADNSAGIVIAPSGSGSAAVTIVNSTLAGNGGAGISASGSATVHVGGSTITGNGTGILKEGGATVSSYGDNRVHGNAKEGAFTATVAHQ